MKLTQLVIVIFFAIQSFGLFSQESDTFNKNAVLVEAGYSFTGNGDIAGSGFSAECQRFLMPKLKLAAGFDHMTFHSNTDNLLQDGSLKGWGLKAYYKLLESDLVDLEIGGGAYLRKWFWLYATGTNSSFTSSEGLELSSSEYGTQTNLILTPSLSTGILFHLSNNISLSLRGLYQFEAISARLGLVVAF